MFDTQTPNTRGQAFTLEGVVASLIIISAVIFALQATAITPLTASTANVEVEEQARIVAGDMLDSATEDDEVIEALLYYDSNTGAFAEGGIEDGGYPQPGIPSDANIDNDFNEYQQNFLTNNGYAFNIIIKYQDEDGDVSSEPFVFQGQPSDNAVTTTRSYTLYDDMPNTFTGQKISEDDEFYAPNIDENSEVYNVIDVQITVWRI